jgi:hypothetical protein
MMNSQRTEKQNDRHTWMLVAIIGGLIVADGIGSILIQGGQYHEFWFDLERVLRTVAGVVLLFVAVPRMRDTRSSP